MQHIRFISVLICLVALCFSATGVQATSHQSATPTPQIYTVKWVGTDGKIERTVRGNWDKIGTIVQQERAKHSRAASRVHPSTNSVGGCTWPNAYFTLFSDRLTCFANPGVWPFPGSDISSPIRNVYEVSSGNNTAIFHYCYGTLCFDSYKMEKNEFFFSGSSATMDVYAIALGV